MKRLLLLSSAVLVLAAVTAAGQTSKATGAGSIEIGGVKLVIGMPEQAVLSALDKQFKLQRVQDTTAWIVLDKYGKPWDAVASLAFKNGRLVNVIKQWHLEAGKDSDLARAIFSAVSELQRDQGSVCDVSTNSGSSPSMDTKSVFIRCGARFIRIDWMNSKGAQTAKVDEVLDAPR